MRESLNRILTWESRGYGVGVVQVMNTRVRSETFHIPYIYSRWPWNEVYPVSMSAHHHHILHTYIHNTLHRLSPHISHKSILHTSVIDFLVVVWFSDLVKCNVLQHRTNQEVVYQVQDLILCLILLWWVYVSSIPSAEWWSGVWCWCTVTIQNTIQSQSLIVISIKWVHYYIWYFSNTNPFIVLFSFSSLDIGHT